MNPKDEEISATISNLKLLQMGADVIPSSEL